MNKHIQYTHKLSCFYAIYDLLKFISGAETIPTFSVLANKFKRKVDR